MNSCCSLSTGDHPGDASKQLLHRHNLELIAGAMLMCEWHAPLLELPRGEHPKDASERAVGLVWPWAGVD